jgi:murein L,D-transpeptidase YcbB/YkuD
VLSVFALVLPVAAHAQAAHYADPAALEKAVQEIESAGASQTPEIPDGPVIREGDDGERVAAVIAFLKARGDLATDFDGTTYTPEVSAAVEAFQTDRGIAVDGLVGPQTRQTMNEGPGDRLDEIRRSLEEQKTFFADAPDRYVLVNIPDAQLIYFEGGQPALEMKVIGGKEGWDTPTMDETIEQIVVNPDWDVPASIVAADIAPKVVENPGYLSDNNMVVLDGWGPDAPRVDPSGIAWGSVTEDNWRYHLRQLPGDDNPLGQVKISFPNDEAIYLHGTPAKQLFEKNERALSHGCIRMERPVDLAGRLLEIGTEDWTTERLRQAVETNEQQTVKLGTTIPVHLVYWTAFVDSSGELQLVPDIYDRMGG